MEKYFEKKNLGIPVTLLVLLSYFIGYYLTRDYSGLLVAVIFGVLVFVFDFDDRVKTAVKQSYFLGFAFNVIYFAINILNQITDMVTPSDYTKVFFLQRIFTNLHRYVLDLFNMFVIVVFALLVICALIGKDFKLGFILNMMDGTPKQPKQQAPQQIPPVYQQVPPMQQPVNQQPVQGTACPKCGTVNKPGASFCSSCGNKL